MNQLAPAERLLIGLGVQDPVDIDLEAIAWTVGVKVKYAPLDNCEARIVGTANRAIVTIKEDATPGRRRFSLGHELGHWHHDRGKCLVCGSDEIGNPLASTSERAADRYAADLLMPRFLFDPAVRAAGKVNFAMFRNLAKAFNTSVTAAAIRVVEGKRVPAMLVCHGAEGRKWFVRSQMIDDRWFPQEQLSADSPAFDIQFSGKPEINLPMKVGADAWFDRHDASSYEVREQSIRLPGNETLTLLLFDDDRMHAR